MIFSKFKLEGKEHSYFLHLYNKTWRNERAVEIPIVTDFIKQYKNRKILEVGNVMSHYFKISNFSSDYSVVDKFEVGQNVINADIMDFNPRKKYDCIVSISTLEHVGLDDGSGQPKKSILAVKKIKSMLNKKGKFICTIPVGYNKVLDAAAEKIFTHVYYLKKVNNTTWTQCPQNDILNTQYGSPRYAANALIIGVIKK